MKLIITLTDEQMADLESGKPITIEPPKPKKWEPKGGGFFITSVEVMKNRGSTRGCRLFGMEYPTRLLAQKARDKMRIQHLMVAYQLEVCPDYEPDWSNPAGKWYVYRGHEYKAFSMSSTCKTERPEGVYFPTREIAQDLCDLLNENDFLRGEWNATPFRS